MRNADHLRGLLRPLGVYDLNAPVNGASLEAKGAALDELEGWLEELERECSLIAAEDWGLENWRDLLGVRPAAGEAGQLRSSLQALLRIGMGPCTLQSVNETLEGCGIPAVAEVTGTGTVAVSFPGTPGMPGNFEQLRRNIEEILPAHVGVSYVFDNLSWAELESRGWTWEDVEKLTWEEVERGDSLSQLR